MNKKEYLDLLSEQIHHKNALPIITNELSGHIEMQKQYFMEKGMSEQEAEENAVLEMGDPIVVGAILGRIHKPKVNWWLIAGFLIFMCVYFFTQYYWLSCYFKEYYGAAWNFYTTI